MAQISVSGSEEQKRFVGKLFRQNGKEFLAETLHGTTSRAGDGRNGARFLNFASKIFLRGVKVLGPC